MEMPEYVENLRKYLKDFDFLNRLLEFEQESSDLQLELYIQVSLGELNGMAPSNITFSLSEFKNPVLVILNGVIHCLLSCNVSYERNQLTYNNGGITVTVPDGSKYLRQIQYFQQIVATMKEEFRKEKISINAMGFFGGNSSPYAALHDRGC